MTKKYDSFEEFEKVFKNELDLVLRVIRNNNQPGNYSVNVNSNFELNEEEYSSYCNASVGSLTITVTKNQGD